MFEFKLTRNASLNQGTLRGCQAIIDRTCYAFLAKKVGTLAAALGLFGGQLRARTQAVRVLALVPTFHSEKHRMTRTGT
jgi:hypothetical protein